jgi:hypothetical protein
VSNSFVGAFALIAGLLFCFFGAKILRFAIAVWGAFIGFAVGAALFAAWFGQGILQTATAWFAAVVLAIVFGALAYAYYVFAVALVVGAFGYGVCMGVFAAVMSGAGASAVLVSLIVGVLLAVLTIALRLPAWLLIFVSAFDGAGAAVAGIGYLLGIIDINQGLTGITDSGFGPWAWLATLLLGILGVVSQSRSARSSQRAKDAWA